WGRMSMIEMTGTSGWVHRRFLWIDGREVYLKVGLFAAKGELNAANIVNLATREREKRSDTGGRG
ncbi:hypothetical protein, partial [Aeromonas caviae]